MTQRALEALGLTSRADEAPNERVQLMLANPSKHRQNRRSTPSTSGLVVDKHVQGSIKNPPMHEDSYFPRRSLQHAADWAKCLFVFMQMSDFFVPRLARLPAALTLLPAEFLLLRRHITNSRLAAPRNRVSKFLSHALRSIATHPLGRHNCCSGLKHDFAAPIPTEWTRVLSDLVIPLAWIPHELTLQRQIIHAVAVHAWVNTNDAYWRLGTFSKS